MVESLNVNVILHEGSHRQTQTSLTFETTVHGYLSIPCSTIHLREKTTRTFYDNKNIEIYTKANMKWFFLAYTVAILLA